mmetsp:Transcript_4769/g.634  ORF Transcript_4769/g.634 Transcript_4769/m.634 type:complete len:117 (-) Transcript_4769:29-379(-)|eukprot:CAMPEP_0168315128 /NCGR_PEP_ID=MMETSP0210-20121227/10223_1 /TAXON_ID=40633 /ORGANISM="Condylostoma magnum, Strain COL2" /LENGTH=116 /DNA_ID=CAMNT_0008286559 /DNA_START=223 /DNA_END=573 /DNA_ORIENTATION=-
MSKGDFTTTTKQLVNLMIDNKRLNNLEDLCKEYDNLLKQLDKREIVRVVSATELSGEQKREVEEALKSFDSSKKFEVTFDQDRGILGGLQLYFPTAFMDLSLKSRLDRIKDELSTI